MQRQTKEEEAAALDMAVKRHREQQTEIVARFRLRLEQEAALEMAVNRHREQEEEEEDAPASIELNANAEPLTLLTLVKSHFDTLVWAQLCNPQGIALFSFVHLTPRVSHLFAGSPVYGMSLTHAERLHSVGCGFKGMLVRLLSLGEGRLFEPQRNWGACRKMMQSNVRRVASGQAAAVRDKVAKEAEELCASGQYAAAAVPLQRAIDFGDFTSLALKAWLLIIGREGVAKDKKRGFALAKEGARLGCHHCQGVLAVCYCWGFGCEEDEARSLKLARKSSGRGSKYGQLALGKLHYEGAGGLVRDYAQAVAFYGLAAAQGLVTAQFLLGEMYLEGDGVAKDLTEALRLFQLSAAQDYDLSMCRVADCHYAAAIHWLELAKAEGSYEAGESLTWHKRGRWG
jgi:hypothetical protein